MASSSSSSSSWQSRTKVTGVIFDMDGTLTEEHAIDFKAMYNRIGIKKRGDDIITQVKEDLHEEEHQRAFDIIVDEEMLGCERMKVKEDLHDCISFLTERDIKMAISTRNCREGVTIHHNMIPVYVLVCHLLMTIVLCCMQPMRRLQRKLISHLRRLSQCWIVIA
jgi:hypothetical protein